MPTEEYERIKIAASTNQSNNADTSIMNSFFRGAVLTHREWEQINIKRNTLRSQWRNLFKEFDVVICPIMPTPAFAHDHSDRDKRLIKIDETFYPYTVQFAWPSIATLFGLPATVAPINYTQTGLPIGVQIIGDYLEDLTTIEFAKLISNIDLAANIKQFQAQRLGF